MTLTADDLGRLPIPDIISIVKGSLQIPAHQRRRKDILTRYVLEHASAPLKSILEETVKSRTTDQPLKRKRNPERFQARKAKRAEEVEQDVHDTSKFLQLPSELDVYRCYQNFYNATSDAALKTTVCGICAREVNVMNDGLSTIRIQDLPTHRLVPPVPHAAHDKFRGGMLLEPQGVIAGQSGEEFVAP